MRISKLSVRFRLLGLCLGLLVVFGSSSLLLGYLIKRNQEEQVAQAEQYRRFATIQAVQEAISLDNRVGSDVNVAMIQKKPEDEAKAHKLEQQARNGIWVELDRLRGFDPDSAQIIESAEKDVPYYAEHWARAVAEGRNAEAEPFMAQLELRANKLEDTMRAATARERTLAERIRREANERAALAIRIAVVITFFAEIVGIVLVLLVVRSIIRPLRITTEAIRQVNAGQLEIDLPPVGGDEFGEVALALRQFRDGAEKLRRLAYLDSLTGLGNRAQLEETLVATLQAPRPHEEPLALFYFDLDNFRSVNDRLGHKAGDAYLCEAATRLQRFLPVGSELFRYGGDKFIAVLDDATAGGAIELRLRQIAETVLRGIGEPYRLGNQLLHMSVSIGIAVSPGDGKTAEHLINSAEAAGHAAKRSGRNNARFADGQLTGVLRRQLALAGEIRRGLEQGEFEVFYQPMVDAENRRVNGAEALIRWRHPERGLLLPGEFIQVAESEGLIDAIGEHCLRVAHVQLREWLACGHQFRISVNVSARQVQDGKILEPLAALRDEDAQATQLIDLELTESVLFDNSENIRRTLEEIKRFGYHLGMDDFGTGYSSFGYLQRLPIDKIKIDRQFISEIGRSRQAEAIISAILALARSLDMDIVAEGVETPLQMKRLLKQGCRIQQGFLFSPAIPAADFMRWVEAYELGQLAASG
jgi:diguanylate cyclase (GGDEF)-like protein